MWTAVGRLGECVRTAVGRLGECVRTAVGGLEESVFVDCCGEIEGECVCGLVQKRLKENFNLHTKMLEVEFSLSTIHTNLVRVDGGPVDGDNLLSGPLAVHLEATCDVDWMRIVLVSRFGRQVWVVLLEVKG